MNLDVMLEDLRELVVCESFSADHRAVARSARVVAGQGKRVLGAEAETIVIGGVTHLRWTFGTPRVLLLGHHDTVWPIGSLLTHPWSVDDGIARGPGVFDMKAGLVQMFHALASLPSPAGVCVLVTGDEEVGSPTSRALIEESARGCAAAFVLEASADGGALKIARKGTSMYEVVVHGRGAHAGLDPGRGANAGVELAHQILAVTGIADRVNNGRAPGDPAGDSRTDGDRIHGHPAGGPARDIRADGDRMGGDRMGGDRTGGDQIHGGQMGGGQMGGGQMDSGRTHGGQAHSDGAHGHRADDGRRDRESLGPVTVTPTVLSAGTTTNTVPALARLSVDARVPTLAAQRRVDELMRALSPRIAGTRLEITGGPNRPPLEHASSAALFALAREVAAQLGLAPLTGVGVGGASDGNFAAGAGCPTLDGLGAVGGGAHADDEHVVVAEMPGRTALLAGLIKAVLA